VVGSQLDRRTLWRPQVACTAQQTTYSRENKPNWRLSLRKLRSAPEGDDTPQTHARQKTMGLTQTVLHSSLLAPLLKLAGSVRVL